MSGDELKGASRCLQRRWLGVATATPAGCRHRRGRGTQQPLSQKVCLLETDMGKKRWWGSIRKHEPGPLSQEGIWE